MRALTLTQPWCGLVASGLKPDENRPRSMIKREDFGKPFALHAGAKIDESVYRRIREIAPDLRQSTDDAYHGSLWYRLSRITSSVLAVATIDRAAVIRDGWLYDLHTRDRICPAADRRWAFGEVVYMLRDVIALAEAVPVGPGGFHRGFWTLPPDIEARVTAQIARTT